MKLPPEHQTYEETTAWRDNKLFMGCQQENNFQQSREKSGIMQNFLGDVLGKTSKQSGWIYNHKLNLPN